MVKHVILWTLKEEYSEQEKMNIKKGIKEGLEGLAGKIPGMVDIKVNIDNSGRYRASAVGGCSHKVDLERKLDALHKLGCEHKRALEYAYKDEFAI